jgi:hypothetical protein
MFRLLARLALLLPALTGALLLLIHLHTYDDTQTGQFFGGCHPMPCWQDIRPGETSLNRALAILRAHPWVASVSQVNPVPYEGSTAPVLVFWTWSSDYPFATAQTYSEQGILITERGLVRQIYLTTAIPFGEMWLAMGDADGGIVGYQYDSGTIRIDSTALYVEAGVLATAVLTTGCATTYPDLWRTPVYMWLRDSATAGNDRAGYAPYLRPGYSRIRGVVC